MMVKQTGVLGRHIKLVNVAGSLLKGAFVFTRWLVYLLRQKLKLCYSILFYMVTSSTCCSWDANSLIMNGASLPGDSVISQQFWILPSYSHFPPFGNGMTPCCWSFNSTLLPVNQHMSPQAVALSPSSHPLELPAFRILPVERNALSASSSSVSCSSLLRSRGFGSVQWARRCRKSGAVLGEDEVKVFQVTWLFIAVADVRVDISFLQALRNWQILWLPYFLCSVHICLCIFFVSEYTQEAGLSLA